MPLEFSPKVPSNQKSCLGPDLDRDAADFLVVRVFRSETRKNSDSWHFSQATLKHYGPAKTRFQV